jgi:hypothetical protein
MTFDFEPSFFWEIDDNVIVSYFTKTHGSQYQTDGDGLVSNTENI